MGGGAMMNQSFIRPTAVTDIATVYDKADSEHWRRKYFDALKSLEQEERTFRSMESVLRRLVVRLCVAATGQSPPLDAAATRLSVAVRDKLVEAELEAQFQTLSDAIAGLDQYRVATSGAVTVAPPVAVAVAQSEPAESPLCDNTIRATLLRLLGVVRQDAELAALVGEVEQQIAMPLPLPQLPMVLSDVADLMTRRVSSVEREKREIEGLLAQITSRLDELTEYLLGEDAERKSSFQTSQEFNTRLVSDMHELGNSVEASVDLLQVKQKVRTRLDTLSGQVHEYREREEVRAKSNWERSEQMRERVESLESETRNLQERLQNEQRLALIDALTQIPNRQCYDRRLEEDFKRWQRFNQPTCIATWDIDLFKKINDAYGHRAGDKVLRVVAETLAGRIRKTDFLARYGGEEFVMILAGTSTQDAYRVAEQMRESVARLGFHFRGVPVSVSVSCGITAFCEGDSADDAFDRADKALYVAKAEGRNRCVVG